MTENWAWLSLSAYSEVIPAEQVTAKIPGSKPGKKNNRLVSLEFSGTSDEARLQELLNQLGEYINTNIDTLTSLIGKVDFQARIGWTPTSPQESIALPGALLLALGRLDADLMIDAYAE